MPNFYLDTEFLEGTQTKTFCGIRTGQTQPTIDLISIALVAEDGREYYAVSSEFNLEEAWNRWQPWENPELAGIEKRNFWIRENVLRPIFEEYYHPKHAGLELYPEFNLHNMQDLLISIGKTRIEIANEIVEFIYGDVFSYDLDGNSPVSAVQKYNYTSYSGYPKSIKFYGYYADYDWVVFCWLFGKMNDLPKDFPMYCRDLQQTLDEKWQEIQGNKKKRDAFERKAIFGLKQHPKYPKQTDEHHALADARWNKKLHEFINGL